MLVTTGRVPLPLTLPRDMIGQLRDEARRRGVNVDRLIDELVADRLPDVLADAAGETLAHPLGDVRRALGHGR